MPTLKEVRITEIEDFDEVDVVEVLVKEGDQVEEDTAIVTIESEKAMMDFPANEKGTIKNILVSQGGKVKEGDLLLVIETQDDVEDINEKTTVNLDIEHQEDKVELPEPKITTPVINQAPDSKDIDAPEDLVVSSSVYASPNVQKYARHLGVNLENISGSGNNNRILEQDVQAYVQNKLSNQNNITNPNSVSLSNSINKSKPMDFSLFGEVEEIELTKIQKITADNMLSAWQNIPHVTHFDQANITNLEKLRKSYSSSLMDNNIKLTPLAFILKAVVSSLEKYPQFNASLDETNQKIIRKKYFHLGVAVDTPAGLLVPVLRDVDKKDIVQIAQELITLSEQAKQRKLAPENMKGASFTISSLGNLGGQAFTPLINPPEVAILGVSKIIIKDERIGDVVETQKYLPISLSYDHRVINGADAARFCSYLISVLEDYWKIIL